MSDKKSLSIQEEEILMEQIRILSLYGRNKISWKEHDVNSNAWSKAAKEVGFHIAISIYPKITLNQLEKLTYISK